MKCHEINLRDPFVLPCKGKYYLYGSRGDELWGKCLGFDVYESDDLSEWQGPSVAFERPCDFWADREFWAPEVHRYRDAYYMLATFKGEGRERGTQILKSRSPKGPFLPHSNGPVTPPDWSCLDGTLYIENGTPYMIFCHEWSQIYDGQMCLVELSPDLRCAVGEPRVLFSASEAPWVKEVTTPDGQHGFVTDGPYLYRTKGGKLLMLWSSFDEKGYVQAIAVSSAGTVHGDFHICDTPLLACDSGHGMIFKAFDGALYLALHAPNRPAQAERVRLFGIRETDTAPFLALI